MRFCRGGCSHLLGCWQRGKVSGFMKPQQIWITRIFNDEPAFCGANRISLQNTMIWRPRQSSLSETCNLQYILKHTSLQRGTLQIHHLCWYHYNHFLGRFAIFLHDLRAAEVFSNTALVVRGNPHRRKNWVLETKALEGKNLSAFNPYQSFSWSRHCTQPHWNLHLWTRLTHTG